MSKELITLQGAKLVKIELTPEAHLLKQDALAKASSITAVTDSETQQIAVNVISLIKRILKELESSRTAVKAPVLDMGKLIDQTAKSFSDSLNREAERINALVQTHYRAEKEKADRERRMLEEMENRRRAKAEAEARRLAEEAERIRREALQALSQTELTALEEEAREKARLAEDAKFKADTVPATTIEAPAKADKMSVSTVWKHRVVDIAKLYAARPEFVVMEPRTGALNAEIRGGTREIPGVEIWEETDVNVRS